jgi:translation initiation factor IF-1
VLHILKTRFAQVAFAVSLATLAPVCALAATVDATTIPDGTYNAKVQKVVDPKHVVVLLDNGNVTTFVAGRDTVDFTKVQPNDQLKVSLIKGSVMVYADLTSH